MISGYPFLSWFCELLDLLVILVWPFVNGILPSHLLVFPSWDRHWTDKLPVGNAWKQLLAMCPFQMFFHTWHQCIGFMAFRFPPQKKKKKQKKHQPHFWSGLWPAQTPRGCSNFSGEVLSLKHETRLHLVLRSPWPAFRLLDLLARLIPEWLGPSAGGGGGGVWRVPVP